MTPATRDWLAGLRDANAATRHVAEGEDSADPAADAAERAILGAHLATWLDATPALLEARRAFARSHPEFDAEAAIVITTSRVGIAVAEELLGGGEPLARAVWPRIACVTEREYRGWCMQHPDEHHRLHVNHWSWIKTRVPEQRHAEFARHPLGPGESYWLHRVGTAGAGAADGRTAHLWKFNGRHAALLEPFIVEGRGAPPRGYSSTQDLQPP